MPFPCYTPRAKMHSAPIGGFFISADGRRLVIPDHWLTVAELSEGGRLLRLDYTFCSIEIAGECLDPILEDVAIGEARRRSGCAARRRAGGSALGHEHRSNHVSRVT